MPVNHRRSTAVTERKIGQIHLGKNQDQGKQEQLRNEQDPPPGSHDQAAKIFDRTCLVNPEYWLDDGTLPAICRRAISVPETLAQRQKKSVAHSPHDFLGPMFTFVSLLTNGCGMNHSPGLKRQRLIVYGLAFRLARPGTPEVP